jgi:hypothetical protein
LSDAVIVNPYAIEDFADSIKNAIEMPPEDRLRRMRAMRKIVREGIFTDGRRISLPTLPPKESMRSCFEWKDRDGALLWDNKKRSSRGVQAEIDDYARFRRYSVIDRAGSGRRQYLDER